MKIRKAIFKVIVNALLKSNSFYRDANFKLTKRGKQFGKVMNTYRYDIQ